MRRIASKCRKQLFAAFVCDKVQARTERVSYCKTHVSSMPVKLQSQCTIDAHKCSL